VRAEWRVGFAVLKSKVKHWGATARVSSKGERGLCFQLSQRARLEQEEE
jgi:hypothetical protein